MALAHIASITATDATSSAEPKRPIGIRFGFALGLLVTMSVSISAGAKGASDARAGRVSALFLVNLVIQDNRLVMREGAHAGYDD